MKYEIIKILGRFAVVNKSTNDIQSSWMSLIDARNAARNLNWS